MAALSLVYIHPPTFSSLRHCSLQWLLYHQSGSTYPCIQVYASAVFSGCPFICLYPPPPLPQTLVCTNFAVFSGYCIISVVPPPHTHTPQVYTSTIFSGCPSSVYFHPLIFCSLHLCSLQWLLYHQFSSPTSPSLYFCYLHWLPFHWSTSACLHTLVYTFAVFSSCCIISLDPSDPVP